MDVKRGIRIGAALGVGWMIATFASAASADEDPAAAQPTTTTTDENKTNVCKDSYEQAQVLMKPQAGGQSKLLPAREALRTCMRSNCKDWMVADCSKWLGEVESRIPTVVFSARNTANRDLAEVSVARESGEQLVPRLDGRAIEIEPGSQIFVFVAPDGTTRDKRALVREGEKAQNVSAIFDASAEELAAAQPGQNPGSGSFQTGPSVDRGPSTMKLTGYGLAGVGVVGLGIGAIFGAMTIAHKSEANCDSSGACDKEPLDAARTTADVSTVAFIAGAALLAGGVTLVLLAPKNTSASRAAAGTRVTASFGGTSFGLTGRW